MSVPVGKKKKKIIKFFCLYSCRGTRGATEVPTDTRGAWDSPVAGGALPSAAPAGSPGPPEAPSALLSTPQRPPETLQDPSTPFWVFAPLPSRALRESRLPRTPGQPLTAEAEALTGSSEGSPPTVHPPSPPPACHRPPGGSALRTDPARCDAVGGDWLSRAWPHISPEPALLTAKLGAKELTPGGANRRRRLTSPLLGWPMRCRIRRRCAKSEGSSQPLLGGRVCGGVYLPGFPQR